MNMDTINGVTIDQCNIGKEYWLDVCMYECGEYAGNGEWIPIIVSSYSISSDGLVRLKSGLFYPKN